MLRFYITFPGKKRRRFAWTVLYIYIVHCPVYLCSELPILNKWIQQQDVSGKSRGRIGMRSTTLSSLQLRYEIV